MIRLGAQKKDATEEGTPEDQLPNSVSSSSVEMPQQLIDKDYQSNSSFPEISSQIPQPSFPYSTTGKSHQATGN